MVIAFSLLKSKGHIKERPLFNTHGANLLSPQVLNAALLMSKDTTGRSDRPSQAKSQPLLFWATLSLSEFDGQVFYYSDFPS